jgi:hypothetical protein
VLIATALAVAASPAQASPRVAISDCGRLVQRPAALTVACADANYRLAALTWSSWGGATARAAGRVVANDCSPYCAAGKFHSYRATAEVSRPRSCLRGRRYTVLTIRYPGRRPQGIGATDVHTFSCTY